MQIDSFYSHGKLLITAEYVVLNGALALALPTVQGQKMSVKIDDKNKNHLLHWTAYNHKNETWFETIIDYKTCKIKNSTNEGFSNTLKSILIEASKQTDYFTEHFENLLVETFLEFPNDWGLGSSSTFINNIAHWLCVDAYSLLSKTMGGSGYDIACAKSDSPILYQLVKNIPKIQPAQFYPKFHHQLYFIHLNVKQNSGFETKKYKQKIVVDKKTLDSINEITNKMLVSKEIEEFSDLITQHEILISELLKKPTIKQKLFSDYPHAIKSLGAWGGDFILVVAKNSDELNYFSKKGYNTIVGFKEMIIVKFHKVVDVG